MMKRFPFKIKEGDITLEFFPKKDCYVCKNTGYRVEEVACIETSDDDKVTMKWIERLHKELKRSPQFLAKNMKNNTKVCSCILEQIPLEMERCKLIMIL